MRRFGQMFVRSPPLTGGGSVGITCDVTAADLSRDTVNTMLQAATAGQTLCLPAGSVSWTDRIVWSPPANVRVLGAGSLSTMGGGDVTVITDEYASGTPLISTTLPSTGVFRMAGITFKGSSAASSAPKDSGLLIFYGPATLRLDHIHWDPRDYTGGYVSKSFTLIQRIYGVMDHCITRSNNGDGPYFYNGSDADTNSDTVWNENTAFGSSSFFFMEDNQFIGVDETTNRVGDSFSGARTVLRFNTLTNAGGLEQHHTGQQPGPRGPRAHEVYGNRYVMSGTTPSQVWCDVGNGCWVIWGNDIGTAQIKDGVRFRITRRQGVPNSPVDQTATPNGWGYCGTEFNGTGSNWDQGTFASSNTVKGYPCLDQPGRGVGQLLNGNFPTKVNTNSGIIETPHQALEPVHIFKNSGTVHGGFGGSFLHDDTNGRMTVNVDYYQQTDGLQAEQSSSSSPFNGDGTPGCGWGTLANRPACASGCVLGSVYWATDQGSWYQASSNPEGVNQAGQSGKCYVLTADGTWTPRYGGGTDNASGEPYVYPHPLNVN